MEKLQLDTFPQVSAQHAAQGSGTDLSVPHCIVLTHPLAALLNVDLIDTIIPAHNPLEANPFEGHQLAGCHPEREFGRGYPIIHDCL